MSQIPKRKSSLSSQSSYHSIDQFRFSNPFETYSKQNKFPLRPTINILLILLTTLQVYILLSSRIYLRGELVRTFLSVYIDQYEYPGLFDGKQFYLEVINIEQLKRHFDYMFKRINIIENDSFIDLYYKNAKIELHTEFKSFLGDSKRQTIHQIDPKKGIIQPFNMTNLTNIQLYLMQIEEFQIRIENLEMKENWEGFSQKYLHEITYQFENRNKIQVNFKFKISNAMINDNDDYNLNSRNNQQNSSHNSNQHYQTLSLTQCLKSGCYYRSNLGEVPFPTTYIVKIRLFYGIVMILAAVSLYLNYISIRRTYKILYEQLRSAKQHYEDEVENKGEQTKQSQQQQTYQIRHDVRKWAKINKMTLNDLKLEHYFHVLEFDVIFSTLSNIFEIVAAFYLVSGIEQERIAGIACLFSWLTIFKFIRNYKKLVLMYELIKLSIAKVLNFFVEFLPVFLSYALLGVCLFTKVSFFSSMSNSVTTLVCLMMGDSIEMITQGIIEKNSVLLAVFYIFSFVLLFMHGIHNTLTSLIKQFFIMKKIELVKWQKDKKGDGEFIYIQELKTLSEEQKNKLPIKMTDNLMKALLRIKTLGRTKTYRTIASHLCHELQGLFMVQRWMIKEDELKKYSCVKEEYVRRSILLNKVISQLGSESVKKKVERSHEAEGMQDQQSRFSSVVKDSLISEQNQNQ